MNDTAKSELSVKKTTTTGMRWPNSLVGPIGEVRTSAKVLQYLSNKTLCHTFDIATLRDSSN